MRFAVNFGIDKSAWVQNFIILGARWEWFDHSGKWIEIHILGFRFYFDLDY